ncbi:hypothetical protein KEM48_013374 [Puccinia striiformis f. sp. tritici PST-130]|nr:hypothetical protein KEM48_013374 [Puccinia striiformis f. sp. tritici PST-130]
MSTSKLKPKQSIYFDKSTEEEVKQPAAYLPESYRQDFKRSNKKNTKKSIVEEKEDSDAEGSIEVLEEQELIIQPSTSNQQTKKSNQSLAKDPLPFTLSPQVYRTSRSTAPKDKKKTRRIALGSSDEEDVRPIPAKKDKKRTRRRIDSESDDDHQISIIKSKQKKKPKLVQKKRPRLASSSSGSTTNDESEEETTEEEEEEDEEDADCSIAIISGGATRKSSRPATKKLRRKIDLPLSDPGDDDDDQNLGSEQDEWKRARSEVPGSDEDDGGNHHQGVSEIDALEFFNSCNVIDLPAVTACTLDQAKIIVSCRPFINADDMKSKLRKKKGVNSGILNHYQDMMKGYFEVDRVLSKCEKHGRDLSSIMDIWANRVQSTSSNAASSKKEEEEEGATDLVNHLTDAQGLRTEKRSGHSMITFTLNLKRAKEDHIEIVPDVRNQLDEFIIFKRTIVYLGRRDGIRKDSSSMVVPSSTLENWKREFGNFSNNLTVREYYGSQMERMDLRYELKSMPDLDVVITTYNIATGQSKISKRYKDLMRMKVRWRLLLTGTPLQNNLQELVSLLSFILPKIFGGQAQNDLRMIFKVPSDAQVNLLALTRITRAKKMMSPFVFVGKRLWCFKIYLRRSRKLFIVIEPNQSDAYNQLSRKVKNEFTNDPTITVFLLSTRAGGLGLNLMAADTVIIFDQDFNPHNDRQAEDRAYRLGQTRDVKVFKLISKGTIEEDILQLASTKIEIDNSISSTIPPPAAGTTETTTPVTIIGSSHTTLTNNKNKEDDDIEVLQSNSTLNTQTQTQPSSSSSTTITSTPQAENSLKKSLINRFRKRVLSNNDP